ncbi:ATP-dependent DNA ligase [Arthrobacter sp. MMS18-M83]|uniref:ATP-dependent DNA ligase n=1 Tax=Arthrobacter sp. MMS18-M83 TaxID=2996261 RepID=UPI00227C6A14|nr:ATP-dependent DNA ligase [Arthrobacter sp. MMS18-M83]WAH99733.1 ATP-dependent DNA ligase [Arthrobacter sp. MMS18-M83]
MAESVPRSLHPPIPLALAKAVEAIPPAGALPEDLIFEPKWDGFRACALVDLRGVSLWSRQSKDLSRYLPELVSALEQQVPSGCVIDGEAVLWSQGRLDFEALQRRLVASNTGLARMVRELPASYVAFDLLAVAGHDIRNLPWSRRRELLEELARAWAPPLNLSPVTTDRDLAEAWFRDLPSTGMEGLILKRSEQAYEGSRIWLKVKHRQVLDIVCAGVTGPRNRPSTLVAGLPMNGRLWVVGRSTVLSAAASRNLGRYLRPPVRNHPWPEEIPASLLDRFSKDRDPVRLTLVEPIVVEVSADVAWSGRAFRHPLRVLRVRPELDPDDVQVPGHLPFH